MTYDMPERGQILDAIVLEADDREVLLDVGLKRDAVVTYKDLNYLDESVLNTLSSRRTNTGICTPTL